MNGIHVTRPANMPGSSHAFSEGQTMSKGTAIVTGGAGVLGLAISKGLRNDGWNVIILDRQEALEGFVPPDGIRADALDVTDFAACRAYFAGLTELSVLVNNAGMAKLSLVRDMQLDDWNRILELNLTAPLVLTQLATDLLVRSGHGAIVNIASIAGIRAGFGRVAYGASKAGLIQLTRQTALEYAPLGVRCNAVAPGPVDSDMVRKQLSTEDFEAYLEDIPFNRMAEPDEVANAVAYLASEKSLYITGQCLAVDGGFLAAGAGIKKAHRMIA
ncbi:SDR family NAD(P)-dependent oxidoreductase [Burkholderia multivorans]|uniref:SDR family NAD(P)-dependent oxidoreductase n=1 Tax=Burkholderia multivorans TaxID=87883 RepID=UPI001F29CCF3|nr:SDR family oxidoreductase [Burkholderia multivorans]MDN7942564.1 SDR family oxidoreductase [Burkholderia multivorans]